MLLVRETRLVQPGDREWVTVIPGICTARYAISLFIIYKVVVHTPAWYEEMDILDIWKLSVPENDQTNELNLKWWKYFDVHKKACQVGLSAAHHV